MRIPVIGRTLEELQNLTTPKSVPGGNMESYRDTLFDTQTYVIAGQAQLTYFTGTNADLSLNNLSQGGTIPDPEFFQIYYIQCDVLLPPSSITVPLAWRDMDRIVRLGRPILTLKLQGKDYGPWPLLAVHGQGAPIMDGYSDGAGAGVVSTQYASNGPIDGGFCLDGSLWITPKTSFSARIFWGNPLAILADTLIRVTLDGVRSRAIR